MQQRRTISFLIRVLAGTSTAFASCDNRGVLLLHERVLHVDDVGSGAECRAQLRRGETKTGAARKTRSPGTRVTSVRCLQQKQLSHLWYVECFTTPRHRR